MFLHIYKIPKIKILPFLGHISKQIKKIQIRLIQPIVLSLIKTHVTNCIIFYYNNMLKNIGMQFKNMFKTWPSYTHKVTETIP